MSEVGAGSDVVAMKSFAEEKDDHFVLNGTKMWITNGPCADTLVIYALTDKENKKLTAFIVESQWEGFHVK